MAAVMSASALASTSSGLTVSTSTWRPTAGFFLAAFFLAAFLLAAFADVGVDALAAVGVRLVLRDKDPLPVAADFVEALEATLRPFAFWTSLAALVFMTLGFVALAFTALVFVAFFVVEAALTLDAFAFATRLVDDFRGIVLLHRALSRFTRRRRTASSPCLPRLRRQTYQSKPAFLPNHRINETGRMSASTKSLGHSAGTTGRFRRPCHPGTKNDRRKKVICEGSQMDRQADECR